MEESRQQLEVGAGVAVPLWSSGARGTVASVGRGSVGRGIRGCEVVNVQMCSLVCSKAMCPCVCAKYRVSLCVPLPGHAACPGEAPRSPMQ